MLNVKQFNVLTNVYLYLNTGSGAAIVILLFDSGY